MRAALVRLSFRQDIDAFMDGWFERGIIQATYDEFLLKSQAYNSAGKFKTFTEMVANDGRANSLHYKCCFPIAPYIELLKNNIPGLYDNSGKNIRFTQTQFNVIESDISNITAHKVSITYLTETITLLDNIGDYLLMAYGDLAEDVLTQPLKPVENILLLKIVPGLSLTSYSRISTTH